MATSVHRNARYPHIGLKEGGNDVMLAGGLLPFPRTGCVLYAKAILSYGSEIRQAPSRGKGILFSFSGLEPLTPALSPRGERERISNETANPGFRLRSTLGYLLTPLTGFYKEGGILKSLDAPGGAVQRPAIVPCRDPVLGPTCPTITAAIKRQ